MGVLKPDLSKIKIKKRVFSIKLFYWRECTEKKIQATKKLVLYCIYGIVECWFTKPHI